MQCRSKLIVKSCEMQPERAFLGVNVARSVRLEMRCGRALFGVDAYLAMCNVWRLSDQ
jgi:hypothetical protein